MFNVTAFAGVATGAVVGGLLGGPVGLLAGGAAGAGIDWHRRRRAATGSAQAATSGLPASADLPSASAATHLLLSGSPTPAGYYLQKFQASVNLPATGRLDERTRTALVAATRGGPYDAHQLPSGGLLG